MAMRVCVGLVRVTSHRYDHGRFLLPCRRYSDEMGTCATRIHEVAGGTRDNAREGATRASRWCKIHVIDQKQSGESKGAWFAPVRGHKSVAETAAVASAVDSNLSNIDRG